MQTQQLSKNETEFFQSQAIKITDGVNEYYHLPKWYRPIGEDVYEVMSNEELPKIAKVLLGSNIETEENEIYRRHVKRGEDIFKDKTLSVDEQADKINECHIQTMIELERLNKIKKSYYQDLSLP